MVCGHAFLSRAIVRGHRDGTCNDFLPPGTARANEMEAAPTVGVAFERPKQQLANPHEGERVPSKRSIDCVRTRTSPRRDTTPAFIHTARPDGYIDYFNRGWLDFFGKSLDDVCGWRWTETVHPDDVAAIVRKWHAALASGEPFEIETRVRRADGSYRALLHRKLPLHDEHGTS